MIGYIYLIIDTTNWKKYVGQHHYHIENLDPNYHGSGHIIKMIYKKRPETLKEVYLKTCYTQEELDEWEKYFIFLYNTLYPNGYNLTEGGGGCVACEETRKKISDSNKGKHHSEESKKKMSQSRSGEKHHLFGKHRSEETRKKISESLKGQISPRKDVKLSEETKKKLSESHKGLLSGEKHPMFGKHHTDETKRKLSEAKKGKPAHNKGKPMSEEAKKKISKIVLQFSLSGEFIREWPSTAECGRNGFDGSHIAACCRGKYKSAYGFLWKYK